MKDYELQNLLNTATTDSLYYLKALNQIIHYQKKQGEYGLKTIDAEKELLDRVSDLIDQFESVKNQLKAMVEGKE